VHRGRQQIGLMRPSHHAQPPRFQPHQRANRIYADTAHARLQSNLVRSYFYTIATVFLGPVQGFVRSQHDFFVGLARPGLGKPDTDGDANNLVLDDNLQILAGLAQPFRHDQCFMDVRAWKQQAEFAAISPPVRPTKSLLRNPSFRAAAKVFSTISPI